jgi:hypothetical protein
MGEYYRRFIEGFSKIARPMTALLTKKVQVQVDLRVPRVLYSIEEEDDYNTGVNPT